MRNFTLAFALLACLTASVAQAAITSVTTADVPNSIAGFVTTDIFISFDGAYTGSQLWLPGLSTGQVYNHANGSDTAPLQAFVDVFGDLAFDTFLAQGGDRAGDQVGGLALGGGAVNLGGPAAAQFDNDGINQGWNPSPGNLIEDQTDFMVARVTLADSANGVAWYLASAGGNVLDPLEGQIFNGRISFVPEPSTAILALLGLAGVAARRRS